MASACAINCAISRAGSNGRTSPAMRVPVKEHPVRVGAHCEQPGQQRVSRIILLTTSTRCRPGGVSRQASARHS